MRAAGEIINTKGVQRMTIGEVAEALHLVPAAVNYDFRGWEDLAAACFLQAVSGEPAPKRAHPLMDTPR